MFSAAILDLLLKLAGFTHILAGIKISRFYSRFSGFYSTFKKTLFPAKTCYFRPAIRNSRWLAGKSPCEIFLP